MSDACRQSANVESWSLPNMSSGSFVCGPKCLFCSCVLVESICFLVFVSHVRFLVVGVCLLGPSAHFAPHTAHTPLCAHFGTVTLSLSLNKNIFGQDSVYKKSHTKREDPSSVVNERDKNIPAGRTFIPEKSGKCHRTQANVTRCSKMYRKANGLHGGRLPSRRLSPSPPSSVSPPAIPTSTTGVGNTTGGSAPPPAPEAREGVADPESSTAGPSPPPPPVADGATGAHPPPPRRHCPDQGLHPVSSSPRCRGALPQSASRRQATSWCPLPPGFRGRPPSGPHSIPPAGGGLWAAMSPLGGGTPHSASSGLGSSPKGLIPFSSAHRASPPPIHSHPPLLALSQPRPPSAVGGGPSQPLGRYSVPVSLATPRLALGHSLRGCPLHSRPHGLPPPQLSPVCGPVRRAPLLLARRPPASVSSLRWLPQPASHLAARGYPSPRLTPSGTGVAPPSILSQLAGPTCG